MYTTVAGLFGLFILFGQKLPTSVAPKPTEATAFLGIEYINISAFKAYKLGFDNPYGSYVIGVMPESAAAIAGIEIFDYVFGIDQYRVSEDLDLQEILNKYQVNDRATIHFYRKGYTQQVSLTFLPKKEVIRPQRDKCAEPFLGIEPDHSAPAENGVRVDIIQNSTAAFLGIENGAVIHKINDYKMVDWKDIQVAIHSLEVGAPIKVSFAQMGAQFEEEAPIKSYCETKISKNVPNKWQSFTKDPSLPLTAAMVQRLKTTSINTINQHLSLTLPNNNQLELDMPYFVVEDEKYFLNIHFPDSSPTVVQLFNEHGRLFYDFQMGSFEGHFEDDVDLTTNGKTRFYLFIQQNQAAGIFQVTLK